VSRWILSNLTIYGRNKTDEQRTIMQQYGDGTLSVDGWTINLVQRGQARAGCGPALPSSLYQI